MQYIVVTAESASELADSVTSRIADGYRLHGGVSVCMVRYVDRDGYTSDDYTWAQAMVYDAP